MNKKVLTLCAGVLLVSGSAVFTVNALNVGNEGPRTTYVAKANAEVAGYLLQQAGADDETAVWYLKEVKSGENANYYLAPDAAGKWFLDLTDGQIKEVATDNKNVTYVVLDSKTKEVSYQKGKKTVPFKNGGIYLWSDTETQLDNNGLADVEEEKQVILGTAEEQVLDLRAGKQYVATVKSPSLVLELSGSTYAAADWVNATKQAFVVEERTSESDKSKTEKILGFDYEGTRFYLKYSKSFSLTTDKKAATAATNTERNEGAFQFGSKDAIVYISTENKLTTTTEGNTALRLINDKGFANINDLKDGDVVYITASSYSAKFDEATGLKPITSAAVTASSLDYKQLAEGIKVTDANAATALNTWTVEGNKLTMLGKELSSSYGLIEEGKGAAVALSDEGQLMIAGELIYYTESDKKLTKEKESGEGENKTANAPVVLYAVTENDVSAQPASTMEEGKQYIIGQKIEQDVVATAYIATEKQETSASTPGAEYGDEISVDGDGFIIIDKTLDDPKNIIPVIFVNGDNYLGYDENGNVSWVVGEENAIVWILTDAGLITYDSYEGTRRYFAGIDKPLSTSPSDVTYVPDGFTHDGETIETSIKLAGVAVPVPALDDCDLPIIKDVTNDAVLLAFKDNNGQIWYVKNYQGNLTQNKEEADLWYVSRQLVTTDGRVGYTFESRKGRSTVDTKNDDFLTINGVTQFYGWDCNTGKALQLVAVNGAGNLVFDTTTAGAEKLTIDNTGVAASVFGMYRSPLDQFTAQWLVHRYGSSFQLNFKDWEDYGDKEWIGNVFDGADLVPVAFEGWRLTEIAPDNDVWRADRKVFLLKDRNTGFYIVLDHTGKQGDDDGKYGNPHDFIEGGYPFTILSESNVLKALRGETIEGRTYYPYFRINYVTGTTSYNAKGINNDNVTDATGIACIEVAQNWNTPDSQWYDVVIFQTDDQAGNGHKDLFVTVESHCAFDERKPDVSFNGADNIVHGQDATNNPLNYRYVNIEFEAASNMQYLNEDKKYVNLDGKVLGLTKDGLEAIPSEPNYFLKDKAEGQWAVSMTEQAGKTAEETKDGIAISNDTRFTFTNRESGASIAIKAMHALGNDLYAVEYESNGGEAFSGYAGRTWNGQATVWNRANRDTLKITPAKGNLELVNGESAKNMDSYANWTKEQLQDRTFQLSIDAAAQLYVTENEAKGSHFLGLTANDAEVTNWRLVPMTEARDYAKDGVKYLTQGTDSVYTMSHPHYFAGGKVYAYNDTTAIIAYALQNIENNEYLTYDPSQNQTILSMICDPNSKNFSTSADLGAAYRFVLKEKAEGTQAIESGKYNIIGVTPWGLARDKYVELYSNKDKDGNTITGEAYYELNLDNKLYGASTNNAIQVKGAYVEPTAVDIFTIATTASQEYAEPSLNDTIRIYGAEENDYVLYENGRFLNLGNDEGIAPAMVIDTAYVNRPGNNRYQYLLVVNHDYIEPVYDQLNGGDYHLVKPDTMKGRFLVNQIDSALHASKMHNNPYINDVEADEKELKLGFQWGYRTQDKLFLTDGQNGPVIETIELGTPDFNKAKFAFKYVNQAVNDEFRVQTAFYDYDAAVKAGSSKAAGVMNNEGYLKSVNGVIVVTNGYTHGEEFLMAQEDSNPTANESINANGAVSVVATDGAVVIKGAEGKNVVIATILGKVVANETINSDNETIAVPAGIAVVSVDGESFKVVVK